ncbi:MAG TPA: FAD-binding oxidoreductase [Acidimicrobiales bacterium]|nr:FAD-binding oxidoreductase [Acidimicrobiales bacterium]
MALPTRHAWEQATVVEIRPETKTAKTFRFRLPSAPALRAGQHYIVRLSAPDGYTASRSYSVASAPDGSSEIELTVERLGDGEVSSFLHDDVMVGDELELRGPIGGWFVWSGDAPAVLVGGGSGVVPLMAMLRLARRLGTTDRVRLVVSVRAPGDLYYADELPGPESTVVYTRTAPPSSTRAPGRLTEEDLAPLLLSDATAYVCGSAGFADGASDLLVAAGVPTERIRVERFGPTG